MLDDNASKGSGYPQPIKQQARRHPLHSLKREMAKSISDGAVLYVCRTPQTVEQLRARGMYVAVPNEDVLMPLHVLGIHIMEPIGAEHVEWLIESVLARLRPN
jgi:hypothetical protein